MIRRKPGISKRKIVMSAEDRLLEEAVLGRDEGLRKKLKEKDKRKFKSNQLRKRTQKKERKPAWLDQEENNVLQGYQAPEWADLNKKDEEEEELEELKHAGDFLNYGSSNVLQKGVLEYKHCTDINHECHNEGHCLRTVEFHPSASVAVVAGLRGIASLYQVDGKTNPKIQSIIFKKFPIITSHFSADGNELIAGSNLANHFYYYDMIAGKAVLVPCDKEMGQENMKEFEVSPDGKLLAFQGCFGYIHLITSKTKEWVSSLRMNGKVRSLAFNQAGDRLYSHGNLGEVYIWDLNTRDCIHKFYDDGCIKGTAINLSPNGQYLACGSDSGVVNIYDTSSLLSSSTPKPLKILLNLTTTISKIKFNHTSELMLMMSEKKENAIRAVHCQSMEVFSNFPKIKSNIKMTKCFDISLNSGYLAMANNGGKALLYRLNHYHSY